MEDKLILEILDQKYKEARGKFTNGEHSSEDLMIMMLKHQTNHIAHLEVDIDRRFDQIVEEVKRLDQKIDSIFWKMLGLFAVFSSIIIASIKF